MWSLAIYQTESRLSAGIGSKFAFAPVQAPLVCAQAQARNSIPSSGHVGRGSVAKPTSSRLRGRRSRKGEVTVFRSRQCPLEWRLPPCCSAAFQGEANGSFGPAAAAALEPSSQAHGPSVRPTRASLLGQAPPHFYDRARARAHLPSPPRQRPSHPSVRSRLSVGCLPRADPALRRTKRQKAKVMVADEQA